MLNIRRIVALAGVGFLLVAMLALFAPQDWYRILVKVVTIISLAVSSSPLLPVRRTREERKASARFALVAVGAAFCWFTAFLTSR